MNLFDILREYGWFGVLLLFVIEKVWPFFVNVVFPKRAREATALIKREDEERKWQRDIDERRVKAMEDLGIKMEEAMKAMSASVSESGHQVAMALTVQNERINKLSDSQVASYAFLVDAVTDMREATAKLHPNSVNVKNSQRTRTRNI